MKRAVLLVVSLCAVSLVACEKKPPPKAPPAKSSQPSSSTPATVKRGAATQSVARSVHPGAFCADAGAVGTRKDGAWYVCRDAGDGRLRWMFDHR